MNQRANAGDLGQPGELVHSRFRLEPPSEIRRAIREGRWQRVTHGLAPG